MNKILIIDDEESILTALTFALEDTYEVSTFTDPEAALTLLESESFHLCLLDLRIGTIDGIEILKRIKGIQPSIEIIMITAYGSIESSVHALQSGAFSYITKPIDINELQLNLDRAVRYKHLNSQVEYLSKELEGKYRYRELIGSSKAMQPVYRMIDKVKDVDSTILITGQSGTGKELVVRAIHFSGKRQKGPLQIINCAAIPEPLLESELFGYEKGAFTGAISSKPGKFEIAQGGTIFLDEIGDMPQPLQVKLLRVLQSKKISRLGSNTTINLDVRVIAATNMDLAQAIVEKTFREDLYFRINVIQIQLPPLSQRKEDIPLLVAHYIRRFNTEQGLNVQQFTREALSRLAIYNYPGNIRELINIIEYSMVMSSGSEVDVEDLPENIKSSSLNFSPDQHEVSLRPFVGLSMRELEEKFINETLKFLNGHRRKTAETLGISERNLRYRLNSEKNPDQET
ncbi:sigma-54 dependent transcriptional regulator [Desulforhopalus sp. IMCC35007]|uniref:sigma-54-dependent transcriptional regulator n=1 Tax=Desulforhopalus sp. IMCC35007 TaxID=2569543 RepID=UPI0010AEDAF5|nr:sigma-54 dependent transcriptional regulator [Desulforhopalus sp. IMCC35007]TKB06689.1 sigma-54-dependent Fis family transcriptional regulator [Desulforhopalus sp. IMCC35007]